MKVALFTEWFLPRLGGIELQVRDLAHALRSRGHDVEVITPVDGPADIDGLTVHRLGAPRLPRAGIVYTAQAFARIHDVLAAGRYDVVHVHFGIISPAAYGACVMAQRLGIPTIATFHSVLTDFRVPLGLLRAAMGIADWNVQWSAVSTVVAESMRPLVGDAPVELLPNAIDASFWATGRNDARRATPAALRAVSVMRLHPRKRPALLVEAFRNALARTNGGGAHSLTIIGDGPEMARLRRQVAEAGLEGIVTLAGWMPRDDVRVALHAADVFLLPSRLEAFGIAALEARAAGVPVIAMAAGGTRDFLTHGHDSLLADDDAAFARILAGVASDPALVARLRAGAAQPPAAFDWQALGARVESAYRRAVDPRAQRAASRPERSAATAAPGPSIPAR